MSNSMARSISREDASLDGESICEGAGSTRLLVVRDYVCALALRRLGPATLLYLRLQPCVVCTLYRTDSMSYVVAALF